MNTTLISQPPHPLDQYTSKQTTLDELATMQDIYDRAITDEGVTQEDFAKILQWVGEQADVNRFEEAMNPLMVYLKKDRNQETGGSTIDGDYIGEQIEKVKQYIWDNSD